MEIEAIRFLSSPLMTVVMVIIITGSGLWKSYLGPILASILGFSLLEAFGMIMLAGLLSAKFSALLSQYLLALIRQSRHHSQQKKAYFNPKIRKLLRFWQRYGLPLAAFTAPTIIGIPTYSFIARRLQTKAEAMYFWLSMSLTFWILTSYYLGHFLIALGLVDLSSLLALVEKISI